MSKKEIKARVEDALHATRAEVEEGIVAGCGAALLCTRQAAGTIKGGNAEQDAGIKRQTLCRSVSPEQAHRADASIFSTQ
jgi:chaperonin GroEL (HSP60 family)